MTMIQVVERKENPVLPAKADNGPVDGEHEQVQQQKERRSLHNILATFSLPY
jgi:hypothetical protein